LEIQNLGVPLKIQIYVFWADGKALNQERARE
jgi:hypothetical protein